MVLMLAGCGAARVPKEMRKTALVVSQKGKVTSYLVDVLDKEYYDLDELTDMASKEVEAYNEKYQEGKKPPVVMKSVKEQKDGQVAVIYQYLDTDVYENYNDAFLHFSECNSDLIEEYELEQFTFVQAKSGDEITNQQNQKILEDKYVLITDVDAVIYCPYRVAYVSEGGIYKPDGTVDTASQEGERVVILMEK